MSNDIFNAFDFSNQNKFNRAILVCSCVFSSLSSFLLMVNILIRFKIYHQYEVSTNQIPKTSPIYSKNRLLSLLIELVTVLPHPNLITINSSTTFSLPDGNGGYYDYLIRINEILIYFVLFRVNYLLKYVLNYSVYRCPRSIKITQENGEKNGYIFAFKCLFNDYPFATIFIIFPSLVFIFAYGLRITERIFSSSYRLKTITSSQLDYNSNDFSNIENDIWCVFITMMTVGYGDYYSRASTSRITSIIAIFLGILFVGMITISSMKIFELTTNENRVYIFLQRLEIRDKICEISKKIVCHMNISYFYKSKISLLNSELLEVKLPNLKNIRARAIDFEELNVREKDIKLQIDELSKKLIMNKHIVSKLIREKQILKKQLDNIDTTDYIVDSLVDTLNNLNNDIINIQGKLKKVASQMEGMIEEEDMMLENYKKHNERHLYS